jgi:hypothetical protein
MKVVFTKEIGNSPAAIDRASGILYINPDVQRKLTPFQQKFVYWHEIGHYYLDTNSEIEADAYAFDRLAGTEFRSLKQCLECLTEILDKNNPTLRPRYDALMRRALQWDAAHGNKKAIRILAKQANEPTPALNYSNGSILWGLVKWGNSATEEANADYTRAQGVSLIKQTLVAGENLLEQTQTMNTLYIVIGVVLAIYLLKS